MSKKAYGYLLWGLILLGYFLFVFNWIIMDELRGSVEKGIGWEGTIKYMPNNVGVQAINYSITAMKGIGAMSVGYIIAKVGHKYAVIISLTLLSTAFFSIFFARIGGIEGYCLLISGRMVMAVGGSIMIIYTQPIIGKYFNRKEKTLLSRLNSLGFNISAALGIIIFAPHVLAYILIVHWELFDGIVSVLPIFLLITYIFVGKPINITTHGNAEYGNNKNIKLSPTTWTSVIKSLQTWKYILFYSLYLVLAGGVIFIMKDTMSSIYHDNFGQYPPPYFKLLPIFMFIIGLIPGIFLIGRFSKSQYDRRPYLSLVTASSFVLTITSYIIMIYVESTIVSTIIASILMLMAGMLLFGVEGVFFNIPHEEQKNVPQRVAIIISLIWGVAYLIFTIIDIFLSVQSTEIIEFIIWVVLSSMLPISAMILPQTKKGKTLNYFRRIFNKKYR